MGPRTKYQSSRPTDIERETVARAAERTGFVKVCSSCKRIQDQQGWTEIKISGEKCFDVKFTHGICPECTVKLYPEVAKRLKSV
jgi:rubredoxin